MLPSVANPTARTSRVTSADRRQPLAADPRHRFRGLFSGGFFCARTFTLPTHGNPAQVATTSPRRPGLNLRSAYRLFLADAIPFRSGIRLAIEHGPTDDVPAEMSSVVFHYAIPEATIAESDAILIGAADSEQEHALVADDRVDQTLTSATRGDDSDAPFTLDGCTASVTRFRVATLAGNEGVRLRRFADIGAGRQTAVVRVDGTEVGVWSSADETRSCAGRCSPSCRRRSPAGARLSRSSSTRAFADAVDGLRLPGPEPPAPAALSPHDAARAGAGQASAAHSHRREIDAGRRRVGSDARAWRDGAKVASPRRDCLGGRTRRADGGLIASAHVACALVHLGLPAQ
jgi:hypothetical protein